MITLLNSISIIILALAVILIAKALKHIIQTKIIEIEKQVIPPNFEKFFMEEIEKYKRWTDKDIRREREVRLKLEKYLGVTLKGGVVEEHYEKVEEKS